MNKIVFVAALTLPVYFDRQDFEIEPLKAIHL